jgi:hypothetical protein
MELKFELFYKDSKEIMYYTHQGLGDLISCSPIVNYLSEIFPNKKILYIVQKNSYKDMLKSLIKHKNVIFHVPEEWNNGKDIDKFGSHLLYFKKLAETNKQSLIFSGGEYYFSRHDLPWDYSFYSCIGLNYSLKYKNFYIDEKVLNNDISFEILTKNVPFIFIHDDPDRGRIIEVDNKENLRIVRNDTKYPIFDFLKIALNAEESHIMGSSLLCLLDFFELDFVKRKYYFYDFRGSNVNFRGKENWIQVK